MKYLLFINYITGLKHNAVYKNIEYLQESITQLIEEEDLNIKTEKKLTIEELVSYFKTEDDLYVQFSNGTWYHIQELTGKNYIR